MTRTRLTILAGAGLIALSASPALAQFGPPQPLADGEGKELVEGLCTACHQTGNIIGGMGYSREDWAALMATMVDLSQSPARDTILTYLAEHYPPNGARAATLVEGPLDVTFTEWAAPQLGQRTRDPVEAPDGSIWYVGQMGNTIGRIDPETGQVDEWTLPENALPHSVNVDADGGVWYLGNGNGTIGKFDPVTGAAEEIRMPDPAARDPHTGEFDADGVFWFTLQQSNMIGRLDPTTRDVKLVTAPTERSRPYGIKVAADGSLWAACNGSNCLLHIDPDTMAIEEIKLPEGATVRRLDFDDSGMLWYGNGSQGKIGRYNPQTGEITEWDSPSGPRSAPYGLEVVDNVVWYNESGVRPDALVRFDPATETFQSWAIQSAGVHAGIVRHMRPTRDGDLLIHQGSTNRVIRVDLPPAE